MVVPGLQHGPTQLLDRVIADRNQESKGISQRSKGQATTTSDGIRSPSGGNQQPTHKVNGHRNGKEGTGDGVGIFHFLSLIL